MSHSAARNVLLVALAISVGFALGAITKFGFGYTLAADAPSRAPSPQVLAAH